MTPPADRMGECVPGKEALDALDRLIDYAGWATTPKSHRDAVATVRSSLSALREENERLREERDEERQSRIEYMDIARAERGAAQAAEAEARRLTEGLREIEHWPFDVNKTAVDDAREMREKARALLSASPPPLPCGHPESSVVSADEGTAYCGECASPSDGGGAK